jgi:predicted sugar kinase
VAHVEAVMSTFASLRVAIVEYADEKIAAGEVVDLNLAAMRLATKYPQTGMTIDEIADEITRVTTIHSAQRM